MSTVVLVEGVTDELALSLAARRLGRDLAGEGVAILPTNGAHAMGRHLRRLASEQPRTGVAGLYDEGELEVVRSALERAGYGSSLDRDGLEGIGFFACSADLEDELIRAAGESAIARLIDDAGDAQAWHKFRQQQPWLGRPVDQQFRRFIRSVSERNSRYIAAMVEAIEPASLPRPVLGLLEYVMPAHS